MLLPEWQKKLDPEEEMERSVGPEVRKLVEKVVEPGVEELVETRQEGEQEKGKGEVKEGMLVLAVQVVRGEERVVEQEREKT